MVRDNPADGPMDIVAMVILAMDCTDLVQDNTQTTSYDVTVEGHCTLHSFVEYMFERSDLVL